MLQIRSGHSPPSLGCRRSLGELAEQLIEADLEAALKVVIEVFEHEQLDRRNRRVARLRRASKLPPAKTFETLDEARFSAPLRRQLHKLQSGDFLEEATNVLCFGLPGTGKTHVACAIGHALVEQGHKILFTPTFRLVQHLLAAKRDLELPRALRKLDQFDLLILDDIGYVRQSPEEIEVPLHTALRALRAEIHPRHLQSGLQRLGPDLPKPDDHRLRHRSHRPPLRHPRVRRLQLSNQG